MDSLDPIRAIADSGGYPNEVQLAIALLKLADENTELRNRVVSLELDKIGFNTRLDIIKQHTTNLQTLVDQLKERVNIHRDNIELLTQRSHSLELDRDEAARISVSTSELITKLAEIGTMLHGLVKRDNQNIAMLVTSVNDAYGLIEADHQLIVAIQEELA